MTMTVGTSSMLRAEAALIAKHWDRFKGRLIGHDLSSGKKLYAAEVVPPGHMRVGRKVKKQMRVRGGLYPIMLWLRWSAEPKDLIRDMGRVHVVASNCAVAFAVGRGDEVDGLRGAYVPGPCITMGNVIIGEDGVPVYPHELGVFATDDMIRETAAWANSGGTRVEDGEGEEDSTDGPASPPRGSVWSKEIKRRMREDRDNREFERKQKQRTEATKRRVRANNRRRK